VLVPSTPSILNGRWAFTISTWISAPRPSRFLGHVGFVAGADRNGNLLVLGGNQGDAVSINRFSRGRVLGYRWPANEQLPKAAPLPVLAHGGALSQNEA